MTVYVAYKDSLNKPYIVDDFMQLLFGFEESKVNQEFGIFSSRRRIHVILSWNWGFVKKRSGFDVVCMF